MINEIDYDQLGTDDGEFVEIKNTGGSSVNLDDYHIALLQGNGTDPIIRSAIDLPNVSLAVGDYYVICGDAANVPNCDLDVTPDTNLLENDKDGVALVFGGTIVDTVSYEGTLSAPFVEGTGVDAGKADRNDYGFDSLSDIPMARTQTTTIMTFSALRTPGLANVNSTSCGAYVATTGTYTKQQLRHRCPALRHGGAWHCAARKFRDDQRRRWHVQRAGDFGMAAPCSTGQAGAAITSASKTSPSQPGPRSCSWGTRRWPARTASSPA